MAFCWFIVRWLILISGIVLPIKASVLPFRIHMWFATHETWSLGQFDQNFCGMSIYCKVAFDEVN